MIKKPEWRLSRSHLLLLLLQVLVFLQVILGLVISLSVKSVWFPGVKADMASLKQHRA